MQLRLDRNKYYSNLIVIWLMLNLQCTCSYAMIVDGAGARCRVYMVLRLLALCFFARTARGGVSVMLVPSLTTQPSSWRQFA